MCAACGKKQIILYIKSILERYTDPGHRLSQGEIAELITKDYGLTVDRKTVARNLTALSELGVEIGLEGGAYLACRPVSDGVAIAAALSGLTLPEEFVSPTARAACLALGAKGPTADTEKLSMLSSAIEAGDRITFQCPTWAFSGYKPRGRGATLRPCALYWSPEGVRLAAEANAGVPCSVLTGPMTEVCRVAGRRRFSPPEREALLTALSGSPITATLLCSEAAAGRLAAFGSRSATTKDGVRVAVCAPPNELVELALMAGAKVLSPKSVKEAVVERLIALADLYTE
ncbi:hypothetical protein SDC9_89052 [bioreactor metagenome]|uniref:WYL domain-containing protein n=1 Tax=bioreactor metagenome TaxID=1076179 RepID=A0A644ZNT4_9ZZZZ